MGWSLPQDYGNKARTLTAVLYRTPAMALNINTIIQDTDAFLAQSSTLFIPGSAAHRQADPPTRTEDPVPWQLGVTGQLAQCASDIAGSTTESSQFRELTIADDFAFGHLSQSQVEGRTSDLCGAFNFSGRVCHVRGS